MQCQTECFAKLARHFLIGPNIFLEKMSYGESLLNAFLIKVFKVFMQEGICGQTLKFSENSVSFFRRIPKRTVQYIGHQVSNLRSSKLAVAWSCTANFLLSFFIFSELHLFSWSISATEIFRYCSLYNSPPNSGDGYCSSCYPKIVY